MNWKNWPYWVRGMTITGVVFLLVLSTNKLGFFNSSSLYGTIDKIIFFQADYISFYLYWALVPWNPARENGFEIYYTFLLAIKFIQSLVYGAFFGWLYGKIENRKGIANG